MRKYLTSIAAICAVYLILCNAPLSVSYVKDAMNLCFEMIIPTLFPFFICSGILIYSGFCEALAKIFRFCMKPLFRVSPTGASAFVLGIISGYPLGAVTAGELYENNYISKTEAERLLAFCNNSGPLFILGSVGAAVYSDIKIGAVLYLTHILAAITVGIIFRFYKRQAFTAPPTFMTTPKRSAGEIYNIALQKALQNILTVCGSIVFFGMISRLALNILPLGDTLYAVLSGIAEFAGGTAAVAALTLPTAAKLVLTAFIVGFAGLCVHIQVVAVISKYRLSLAPYFVGKLLHGLFAAFYTLMYLHFFPISEAVFAPSASKAFAASSLTEIAAVAAISIVCINTAAVLKIMYLKKSDKKIYRSH